MSKNYSQVNFSPENYTFVLNTPISHKIKIFGILLLFNILISAILNYNAIISISIVLLLVVSSGVAIFLSRGGIKYSLSIDGTDLNISINGFLTNISRSFKISSLSEVKIEEVTDIMKSFAKYLKLTGTLDSGKITLLESPILTDRKDAEEIRTKLLELIKK